MLSVCKQSCWSGALHVWLWAGVLFVPLAMAQQKIPDFDSKSNLPAGQSAFNSSCAACHGLDGRGSDKGVDIAGSPKVRHFSNAQIADIVSNGVPGTGMPAFHNLSGQQVRALVNYLRSLQGKFQARLIPGNATSGKTLFFGKAECSSCHTVSGKGGFIGPDLSTYGSTLSADAIRDQLVKPQRLAPEGYRSTVLVTAQGDRLEGVIRNEDNFSIQLQTQDGSFHLLQKSELQKFEYLETSLMPANYRERLSTSELNDLVSFLMTVAPDANKNQTPGKREDPTE